MSDNSILVLTPGLRVRDGITAHSINLIRAWLRLGFSIYVANPQSFSMCAEVFLATEGDLDDYLALKNEGTHFRLRDVTYEAIVIQYAISTYWIGTFSLNRWISRKKNIPIALCCHEPARELSLLRSVGRRIYKRAITSSNKIFTFSEIGRKSLADLTVSPIEVLPLGVPSIAESQGSGQSRPHLLLFGYYLPDKGFELGVAAAIEALERKPSSLHLTVIASLRERVGSSKIFSSRDRRNFEKFLKSLKRGQDSYPSDIKFFGYLTEEQLMLEIDKTDYLLLPYLNMTNSGVAVTAKAHGLPVISSSLRSLKDSFQESAIYVAENSVASWVSALDHLTTDLEWSNARNVRSQKLIHMRDSESSVVVAKAIIGSLLLEG